MAEERACSSGPESVVVGVDPRFPWESHDSLVGWSKDGELCILVRELGTLLQFASIGVKDGDRRFDCEQIRKCGLGCRWRYVFRRIWPTLLCHGVESDQDS